MESYSQSNEQQIVVEHFKGHIGTLLDIGANEGITLSNSLALIQQGWEAAVVEPSPSVFMELLTRHGNNKKVEVYEFAITEKTGKDILWDSGALLGKGDKALVSTLKKEETKRWASLNIPFTETEVSTLTFADFMKISKYKQFQFISIDAEGYDLCILKQMNLTELGCKCLCIEWNSNTFVLNEILIHCHQHGLKKIIGQNQENIILAI